MEFEPFLIKKIHKLVVAKSDHQSLQAGLAEYRKLTEVSEQAGPRFLAVQVDESLAGNLEKWR